MQPVSVRNVLTDLSAKVMSRAHRTILTLSGGRLLRTAFGMPTVELHTVGRKSDKPRTTMLTTPVRDGDRVVLVASKGGDDRHPDWYLNLVAQPDVELTIDGLTRPMRARTASQAERADLWPRIVAVYKGYESYQRRTGREIPVVICEPRSAGE